MHGISLRTKVFFLFAGAALLTVVPALVLIARAVEDRVYERATEELVSASDALRTYWNVQDEVLLESARRIALERDVAGLLQAGDTAELRRILKRGVAEGREVFAVDTLGRSLVGPPLDTAALNRRSELSPLVMIPPEGGVPLRVAVWPVSADSGVVGIVGVGIPLDSKAIRDLKDVTGGADVALVVGDSIVATTLADSLSRVLDTMDLPAVVERGGIWRRLVETLPYLYSVSPLPAHDTTRKAVLLFRPVAQELRIAEGIRQSLVGIGFTALVLALLLAGLVARIVARPTQALAEAAEDLARGDYGAPLPPAAGDEIGQLTRAFGEMRSAIAEREQRLRSAQAELIHREKLAAMGRLIAQLSHEINNPIYNIQNCLEALERRGDPNDPNREFLDLAQEELGRMAVLTRQLLDQSRPLPDAATSLDLNQMVQRVVTLAGAELRAHGIKPDVRLASNPPVVVAHPDAIQQVLANLVDNAIDAMPAGGTLCVTTTAHEEAAEVVVEDTGGGIADEHLPHVFEAFYTTKPGVRGIGLGLFVSEGIIRGHRGRLSVESRLGEGTRFVIRLPRQALETLSEAGSPEPDTHAAVS